MSIGDKSSNISKRVITLSPRIYRMCDFNVQFSTVQSSHTDLHLRLALQTPHVDVGIYIMFMRMQTNTATSFYITASILAQCALSGLVRCIYTVSHPWFMQTSLYI